jgi:hypothetical protein
MQAIHILCNFQKNKIGSLSFLTEAELAAVADTWDRTPRGAAQSDVARVESHGTAGVFSEIARATG